MAVLGQNIRTGSRHIEIDSIKRFIVVLTPGPADAVSVLPLIRYCGGKREHGSVSPQQELIPSSTDTLPK